MALACAIAPNQEASVSPPFRPQGDSSHVLHVHAKRRAQKVIFKTITFGGKYREASSGCVSNTNLGRIIHTFHAQKGSQGMMAHGGARLVVYCPLNKKFSVSEHLPLKVMNPSPRIRPPGLHLGFPLVGNTGKLSKPLVWYVAENVVVCSPLPKHEQHQTNKNLKTSEVEG